MTGLAIQLSQGQGRQPLAFSGRVLILLTYQTSPRFGNPSPRAGLAGTRAVLGRSLMVDSHAWEEEVQEGPARHCPLHGCPATPVRRCLLRGLESIRGEWRLVCLTHNLLKIWRYGCVLSAV